MRADVLKATDASMPMREMAARRHEFVASLAQAAPGFRVFRRVEKQSSLDRYSPLVLPVHTLANVHAYTRIHLRVSNTRTCISGLTKIKLGRAECEQGRSIDINQFRK